MSFPSNERHHAGRFTTVEHASLYTRPTIKRAVYTGWPKSNRRVPVRASTARSVDYFVKNLGLITGRQRLNRNLAGRLDVAAMLFPRGRERREE